MVYISFGDSNDYNLFMGLVPLTITKSNNDTYLQYMFSQDFQIKSISYSDFYDLCGPFPLVRNSYFSMSILIQPSKGSYIAGEGVYIIISDRDLKSNISISKNHFYASGSAFRNTLPNKAFSTVLPLIAFAELVAKKEEYFENSSPEQLQGVMTIANSLEKNLLRWAEKGVNIFHVSEGFRVFPPEIEKENAVECKNLIENFKVFISNALTFLVVLSDNFIDRVLDPETAIFYKDHFCDLDLFKTVVLNKAKIDNDSSDKGGSKVVQKKGLPKSNLYNVGKRQFHSSAKNYYPKDSNTAKIVQSTYYGLRRLMAPIDAGVLKFKAQEVDKIIISSPKGVNIIGNKQSFSEYLDDKGIFAAAKRSSNGYISTSALGALLAHTGKKGNAGQFNNAVNPPNAPSSKLQTVVNSFDQTGNISFLKLFALGMSFTDAQCYSNSAHLLCLSLESGVSLDVPSC